MIDTPNGHGKKNSRKFINKQISRIVRCFKWGVTKELVKPEAAMALMLLAGTQNRSV